MRCNFAAALEAYRKALELDPKNADARSNLGMNQLWTGHGTEAIAELERAARESPANFIIQGNLGDAYRWNQSAPDKAERAYERSIALAREQLVLNPADTEALSFLATGLAKTGHADEATEPMRRLLAAEGGDPVALSDAAVVAALAGRDTEALALLRKAVAAGSCREILTRQPEFARLRDNSEFRSILAAPQKAAGG